MPSHMLRSQEMVMQIWKCKLWWSYCDGGARGWWWGKRRVVGVTVGVVYIMVMVAQ